MPITTKITAQDLGGSGLSNLQYQISSSPEIPADNDPNWKDFTNGATITENKTGGTWYLYTKVTDNAGNRATHIQKSNPYVVNYSVTYNANGGTGTMPTDSILYNTPYTTRENSFTRDGYTFKGWNESPDGTGTDWTNRIGKPWTWTYNKSITLYAQWSTNQSTLTVNPGGNTYTQKYGTTKQVTAPEQYYTISFNPNGGSETPSINTLRPFAKWTLTGDGHISSETTNPTTYTFGNGNGTLTASYSDKGNAIILPTSTKWGYTIEGWYKDSSLTQLAGRAGAEYSPASSETLYAKWSINNYYLDFNTKVDGVEYIHGYNQRVYIGLKVGGVDKGYVDDYNTIHAFGTEWEIYGLRIDGININYTAKGKVGDYNTTLNGKTFIIVDLNNINISVNNSNYGSVSKNNVLILKGNTFTTNGNTLTLQDGRTVTANIKNDIGQTTTFIGWTPSNGTVNEPTSIVANFSRNTSSSTLTIKLNGGTMNNITHDLTFTKNYGEVMEIKVPTPPKGYTVTFGGNGGESQASQTSTKSFSGWSKSGAGTLEGNTFTFGAGDTVLFANYSNNSITLPSTTRTGYTFNGWYDSITGGRKIGNAGDKYTPTSNMALYAQWTLSQYTLTVNPNGGTWNGTTGNSTFTQAYGSTKAIANPSAPAGYTVSFNGNGGNTPSAQTSTKTFTGWTNSGAGNLNGTTYTFGAGDGTLTANYRNNSITLPSASRTGYTFAGWYDSPSGGNKIGDAETAYTPTSAKTLYAHWTVNNYTLTVNPNGGTWNGTTGNSTFTQAYGSTKAIANPSAPAGYTVSFNGNGGNTPAAQTSTKTFTGWTNSGAGTLNGTTYIFGAGNGTLTANYRNNSITLPSASRTGYTFAGWYDSPSGGNKIGNAGTAYTPTSAKTLYAHWTVNNYTLTVNPNGGTWNGTTGNSTFTQAYGSTKVIANPSAPAGYTVSFNGNGGNTPAAQTSTKTFTGWTNSGAGTLNGTTYIFGAGNGTLTANYRNNSITLPSASRTGYTFAGWYDSPSGGNKIGNAGTAYTPTSAKTLYAHWTVNNYTLTVNPNGGTWNGTTGNSTFTQAYGSTKAIANPLAPAGYTVSFNGNGGSTPAAQTSSKSFTSWSNSGAGSLSGTTYTFGTGNGTLTANYRNNSITLPSTSRTGYTFAGWYDSPSGGNKIGNAGTAYTPTSAKTLYAHWTVNNYTLTVNPNGGTWNGTTGNSTFTQAYGSTKAIANPSAPAGYTVSFNGNGGSTPAAQTSTKSFTSWSNSGAGSLSGTTYTFGAGNGTLTANYRDNSITLPSSSRTGYEFLGWYDSAYGGNKIGNAGEWYTPTNSKTLYAQWKVKTLQITFVKNTSSTDNVSTTQTFTYGAPNQSFSDKGWSNYGYKLLGWHKDRYSKVEEYRTLSSVEDWFIDKYAPNLTIYAIWAPDPQIAITKQPTNQTVVDGNEYSFSISTQGIGKVTYQWYMSENSSSASGWKPVNATGTVCKYTANMGLNGRYFYCEVTATIDGVSKSVKSNTARLTVQVANYSTLKAGKTTFYNTLNQAFNGATSGGGDTGGGTITVLNSLTDNSIANTNKTIRINTNGKTITRNRHIGTTGGTLTINGGGTISNNSTDPDNSNAIVARGGNLTLNGGTRFQAQRDAINMSTGNLNIGSGYFYGIEGDTIVYGGGNWKSGAVSINTAKIYAPKKNLQAVRFQSGKYNATINNTWMGNGSSNAAGKYGNGTGEQSALCIYNSGTVTTNGSTRIYGGPYGGHPIGRYTSGTTNFLGDTYVYSTYSGTDGRNCLWNGTSGIKTTFNSTGRFFSTGYGVADSEVATSYTITKGHFASQRSKYMFYSSSSPLTGYVGSQSTQNYYWMNSLTTTTSKSLNCYYYKKGV